MNNLAMNSASYYSEDEWQETDSEDDSTPTVMVTTKEEGPTLKRVSVDPSSYNLNSHQNPIDTDEEQGQKKQDKEGKKKRYIVSVLENGERLALESVNEKLVDLPRCPAWFIAAIVLSSLFLFVAMLTGHNLEQCNNSMAIFEADWAGDEYNPYAEKFKEDEDETVNLCISLGQGKDYYEFNSTLTDDVLADAQEENDRVTFNTPCLLSGFTWQDFDADPKHCPSFQETGIFLEYDNVTDYYENDGPIFNCTHLVSVVYSECPSFNDAFSGAVAYAFYFQLIMFIICYILYSCCSCDPNKSRGERLRDPLPLFRRRSPEGG